MEISKIGTNQNFLPFSESQFPIVLLEMVDRESHCAEMIFEQRLEKVSYAKMMGTGIPGWVAAVSAEALSRDELERRCTIKSREEP